MKGIIFASSVDIRNVGAYRVAHVLREHGWDIEVIDFFSYWTKEQLVELLKQRVDKDTKFIGFGMLFFSPRDVPLWFFDWIKQDYPELVTILGSQAVVPFDHPTLDYIVQGWGDVAIIALLKYLFSNGEYPKFTTNSINNFKHTRAIDANSVYPAFPLKSLKVIYEDRDFITPNDTLSMEFSRGCIFKCKFCNFPVLGIKGDYTRSAEDFEEDVKDAYYRFGADRYIVADYTFNDYLAKILKYADVVEKLDFKPEFSGFIRQDILIRKPEQMEHLARMRFNKHYYGVETFNYESGKAISKGIPRAELEQGLLDIRNYFVNQAGDEYIGTIGLILGLPCETKEHLEQTRQWLINNWQGQSFMQWVLEIPTPTKDVLLSDIGMNFSEFNYTEIEFKDHDDMELLKKHLITNNIRMSQSSMIWQNEHMNIFDAVKIFNQYEQLRTDYKFSGSNFKSLTEYSMSPMLRQKYYKLLATTYIEKKLSL